MGAPQKIHAAFTALIVGLFWSSIGWSQTWQTHLNNPQNPAFIQPNYPLIFVSTRIVEVANSNGGVSGKYEIGTDVLGASSPSPGNRLHILLPSGQVRDLFPLPVHMATTGLIDTPAGRIADGSVVEPSISLDGKRVYFSYFHDAATRSSQGGLPLSGADLYSIDLNPLLLNPSADPATLPVTRLTTRPPGSPSAAERFRFAMNPTHASSWVNDWGTVYMHPLEIESVTGRKLVYVSNERRLQNSNSPMRSYANNNFNLYSANIASNGAIDAGTQFFYYTTTSVLSPSRLRNGFAYSYQANTEDGRNWQIQGTDSEGVWYPLIGYGINPGAMHLSTFCVSSSTDYLVAARYYNLNNEGFGSLWSLELSSAGQNNYSNSNGVAVVPEQVGAEQITLGVANNDDPSSLSGGQDIGKFTSPACGRADELYFAYSPTSANGRVPDRNHNLNFYRSYIGFRPNLAPFSPVSTPHPGSQTGVFKVIVDSSAGYNLVWPKPVLSWQERSGESTQQFSAPHSDSSSEVGAPYAIVGTSALWNTDRKPFDCWLANGQTPYSPNQAHSNINTESDYLMRNTDGLTFVQNQQDFCEELDPSNVFGVAVHLTSNKIKTGALDYETSSGGENELSRLLGVFSVVGRADQSFSSKVPANVPFDFHLLHRRYALKLTDVRSWHSLRPREKRTNCGGCHQHESGRAIPFEGTLAESSPPLDMVSQTSFIEYDRHCMPTVQTSSLATRSIPEWKQDVFPGFDQYCGTCHQVSRSSNSAALAALSYQAESDLYHTLVERNYVNHRNGALGSPAFWAARGERTDGRDNDLAKYIPDYDNQDWGFRYSSVHDSSPNLCNGSNPSAARWVYTLGQWIDHNTPRDKGGPRGTSFDRFHPTVEFALDPAGCDPSVGKIGFWDDSGAISQLQVSVNGTQVGSFGQRPNGTVPFSLAGRNSSDLVEVVVQDASGNRQFLRKSVFEFSVECAAMNGGVAPSPSPSPVSSPGFRPPSEGVSLRLSPRRPKTERSLRFRVRSSFPYGSAKFYCSTSGGSATGAVVNGVQLALNASALLQGMRVATPLRLDKRGQVSGSMTLPLESTGKELTCQVLVESRTGVALSLTKQVQVRSSRRPRTNYSAWLSRRAQRAQRFSARCEKKFSRLSGSGATRAEIGICRRAQAAAFEVESASFPYS